MPIEVVAVGFPILWCVVCFLLSRMSGWAKLVANYRDGAFGNARSTHYLCSGMIGGIAYNRCMTLRVYDAGLRLSVMLPFRIGHPPLFIPWTEFHDVSIERALFFVPYLAASIGDPVISRVRLPSWVRNYIPLTVAQS